MQGEALNLGPIEPWDEEVNGIELLTKLTTVFNRYLVMPKGAAEAMALWTVYTHCFEIAQFSPRLAFTSALPRSGKTTALDILSFLVPKPLSTSNISPAAVFRVIEKVEPTLMIDEADTFLEEKSNELRGILNSGHRRGGAFVTRVVGDDYEPRNFSTWCPMAIAKIGVLPATLQDRSINIKMQRKKTTAKVRVFVWGKAPGLRNLARMCARWARDNKKELKRAKPEQPKELYNDRAKDNWRLLFAIADSVGGEWSDLARDTAIALTVDEDDVAIQTGEGIVSLVEDRWVAKGGAYTEFELREKFKTILPTGRIGGIIGKLVEAGELEVESSSRSPHRLLVPKGEG